VLAKYAIVTERAEECPSCPAVGVTPPNSHMVIRGRPVGGGPPPLVSLLCVQSKDDEKWT